MSFKPTRKITEINSIQLLWSKRPLVAFWLAISLSVGNNSRKTSIIITPILSDSRSNIGKIMASLWINLKRGVKKGLGIIVCMLTRVGTIHAALHVIDKKVWIGLCCRKIIVP